MSVLRGARHHLLADLGGSGEHHEVHLVDQRLAHRAAAGRDDEDVLGQPALAQALGHQQRGERREARGLQHRGVAGGQRRDAVAEGVGQRVVPGADHAGHADRLVADHAACGPCTNGRARADPLVGQVLGRVLRPEAEGGGGVAHLGELGVLVGLAVLGHDRARDAVRVVDDPLLRAPQDARAAVEAERLPAGLRGACAGHHGGHLVGLERRHRGDHLSRGGVLHLDRPALAVRRCRRPGPRSSSRPLAPPKLGR